MPERSLDGFTVQRYHARGGLVAAFPCLDKGSQDLPVALVVVAIGQVLGSLEVLSFWPDITHVMAFSGIIPALQLDDIGLEVKSLAESIFEVVFAATVLVVVDVKVLELCRRDTHHEDALGVSCCGQKCLILGCRDVDFASVREWPGVPVEDAIEACTTAEEGSARHSIGVARDDEHVSDLVLEAGPLAVGYSLPSERRQQGFIDAGLGVLELEVRRPGAVRLEVVCILVWVSGEDVGTMIKGEE